MAAPMWKQFCFVKYVIYGKTQNIILAPTWCRISHCIQKCHASSAASEQHEIKDDRQTTINHSNDDDFEMEKTIEKTPKAHYRNLKRVPDQPENAEILKLAVIGVPNAGKSTLINRLMGWKVSPVSSKVHTTRKNTNAVFTEDNKQIVFVDTPGLMTATKMKKHNVEKRLVYDPELGVQAADLIAVVVDSSDKWTRDSLDQKVLKVLQLHKDMPSILVLNKMDALKSKTLLVHLAAILSDGIIGGTKIERSRKKLKREKENFNMKEFLQNLEDKINKEGGKFDVEAYLKEKEAAKLVDNEEDTSSWVNSESSTPVISIAHQSKEKSQSDDSFIVDIQNSPENIKIREQNEVSKTASEDFSEIFQSLQNMSENLKSENIDNALTDSASSIGELDSTEVSQDPNQTTSHVTKVKVISEDQRLYREYIKKVEKVAPEVRDMTGWPHFDRVFMVSALQNEGVDELREYLLKHTKPGNWMYHSSVVVDENPIHVAKQIVWEKILEVLPKAVPYQIQPYIVLWEEDSEGCLNIIMNLKAHDKNQFKLLIGRSGSNIRLISEGAKQELLNAFRCDIRLKLQVKM